MREYISAEPTLFIETRPDTQPFLSSLVGWQKGLGRVYMGGDPHIIESLPGEFILMAFIK
jgi:hypothetical protein